MYAKDTERPTLTTDEIKEQAVRMAAVFRGVATMTEEEVAESVNRWVTNQLALQKRKTGLFTAPIKEAMELLTAELHEKGFKHGTIRVEINGSNDELFEIKRGASKGEQRHYRFSSGDRKKKKRNKTGALLKLGIEL